MGHLYLAGMMGSGKSTLAKRAAAALDLPCYDLDSEFVQEQGISIAEYIEANGWKAFREIESRLLQEIARRSDGVVALGGGTLTVESNCSCFADAIQSIYLEITPEIAAQRLTSTVERPLLAGCKSTEEITARLHELLTEREAGYRLCDSALRIDKDETEETTTNRIVAQYRQQCELQTRLTISHTSAFASRVVFSSGRSIAFVVSQLKKCETKRVIFLTDTNVDKLYGKLWLQKLEAVTQITSLTFPSGENSKRFDVINSLVEQVLESGIDRKTLIIALGGGVVTDIAGFIASMLLRGIDWIAVPTTIIGGVDAAIGGKTGIDSKHGKNLIGAFHPPLFTVIDESYYATLPISELRNGWGEIVKYGLLSGGEVWTALSEVDFDHTLPTLELIRSCVQCKVDLVRLDPYDRGIRRHLNLGHTAGHALEAASQFQIGHGEAVAWGLSVMTYLSTAMKLLPTIESAQIERVLQRLFPAVQAVGYNEVMTALGNDKKRVDNRKIWVLLNGIGNPVIRDDVPEIEVEQAIRQRLNQLTAERGKA